HLNIQEYFRREFLIRQNLLKNPMPIYEQAIEEWQHPENINLSDVVAAAPKKLESVSFAPQKGQTLAQAYELLRRSIRKRESRHRQNLRTRYRSKLEQAMFE